MRGKKYSRIFIINKMKAISTLLLMQLYKCIYKLSQFSSEYIRRRGVEDRVTLFSTLIRIPFLFGEWTYSGIQQSSRKLHLWNSNYIKMYINSIDCVITCIILFLKDISLYMKLSDVASTELKTTISSNYPIILLHSEAVVKIHFMKYTMLQTEIDAQQIVN